MIADIKYFEIILLQNALRLSATNLSNYPNAGKVFILNGLPGYLLV